MDIPWKDNLGIAIRFRPDKFSQFMRVMNDKDLHAFLSEPNLRQNMCCNIYGDLIEIMSMLSEHGYTKSLIFLYEHFQEINTCESTKKAVMRHVGKKAYQKHWKALNKYCFGPKPLCAAINRHQSDIVNYLLGMEVDMQTIYPLNGPPRNVHCERGYLKAVETLLSAGLKLDKIRGSALIQSVCQCWDSYDYKDYCVMEEMELFEVQKKIKILRMLLEAGHRSKYAVHAVCNEKHSDFNRVPLEMLKLLLYYDSELDAEIDKETALHRACENLNLEKIKVLINSGAEINKPNKSGMTPVQICTQELKSHCLDYFTDDIVRFLCENGAKMDVICPLNQLDIIELACAFYEESKLPVVLFYLSQGLSLHHNEFVYFLLQMENDQIDSSETISPQGINQVVSVFLMDNAVNTCNVPCGPAGRLVINLFEGNGLGTNSRQQSYLQPDFEMLQILDGAGFVICMADEIEQELFESRNETKQMTLKILQKQLSRIPSLAEFCRWTVRRAMGSGLISSQKVERLEKLPLPKPVVEYLLLSDVIAEKYAQTMYDYFSGKSLKMPCVTKSKTDLSGNKLHLTCNECFTDKTKELKRQTERLEARHWAAEFLEQCQKEDSRKSQENWYHHPEDWVILDQIQSKCAHLI